MTSKEIEELAGHRPVSAWIVKLVNDAIAIEREACAKLCEKEMIDEIEDEAYYICKDLALRIRAR